MGAVEAVATVLLEMSGSGGGRRRGVLVLSELLMGAAGWCWCFGAVGGMVPLEPLMEVAGVVLVLLELLMMEWW